MRLAVAGLTKAELSKRLAALDGVAAASVAPKVGFVFSGQGSQWWAMGRGLLGSEPVFRAALEACDEAVAKTAGWSVLEELQRPEAQSRVAETKVAQPALFALQTALATFWASWGVKPAAVIGHSVGALAALHVSGALNLDEAARIVVLRGEAMQAATGTGRYGRRGPDPDGGPRGHSRLSRPARPGRRQRAALNCASGEPKALEEALGALSDVRHGPTDAGRLRLPLRSNDDSRSASARNSAAFPVPARLCQCSRRSRARPWTQRSTLTTLPRPSASLSALPRPSPPCAGRASTL